MHLGIRSQVHNKQMSIFRPFVERSPTARCASSVDHGVGGQLDFDRVDIPTVNRRLECRISSEYFARPIEADIGISVMCVTPFFSQGQKA